MASLLLIESIAGIRDLIADLLEDHHYRVHAVADVQAATQVLEVEQVDVALVDLHVLPPNDTMAWIDTMRQRHANIYWVLTSANGEGAERARLSRIGWLPKPYATKDLLRLMTDPPPPSS